MVLVKADLKTARFHTRLFFIWKKVPYLKVWCKLILAYAFKIPFYIVEPTFYQYRDLLKTKVLNIKFHGEIRNLSF